MRQQLDFDAFVAARSRALMRTAWLLTGDWQLAEDLLQTSLAKAYLAWHRIDENRAEAYVRGSWSRRTRRGADAPGGASWPAPRCPTSRTRTTGGDRRPASGRRRALAQLPRRQRATVVLRYYCDLSEAETAETLGCSVGTVKSQAAKGLDRLRRSPLAAAVHEGTSR
jgi:RNA polymerase sigma-70 factor (sigma-E family)